MIQLLSLGAKTVSFFSKTFNLGNGSTWPGHIALAMHPRVIEDILKNSSTKVIFIIGTNGKTTTATMLATILATSGKSVIQNTSGANLLNGIASTLLLNTSISGKLTSDYAVFEVDENNLPLVLQHISPKIIIALNLFRDQLDRYGELDSIAKKWNTAVRHVGNESTLILNADDPLIAYVAKDVKPRVIYFGLSEKEKGQQALEHAADSVYCPNCGHKLTYKKIFYSHLGIWECPHCHAKRPLPSSLSYSSPLPGTYNEYNTQAAALAAMDLGIDTKSIEDGLKRVQPAFGRQEKLTYKGKNIQLFLSKNPISMNESLKTILAMHAKHVLFVLNDRVPDGRDISWIWDVDIEKYIDRFTSITVSGDRCYDIALRLAYTSDKPYAISHMLAVEETLHKAIDQALKRIQPEDTLYILPTYSAMLEVRKIVTGKKIL